MPKKTSTKTNGHRKSVQRTMDKCRNNVNFSVYQCEFEVNDMDTENFAKNVIFHAFRQSRIYCAKILILETKGELMKFKVNCYCDRKRVEYNSNIPIKGLSLSVNLKLNDNYNEWDEVKYHKEFEKKCNYEYECAFEDNDEDIDGEYYDSLLYED